MQTNYICRTGSSRAVMPWNLRMNEEFSCQFVVNALKMGTLLRLSITCYSSPPLRAQTPVPFKLWSAFLIGNIDCRTLLGDLRSIHLELLCRKTLRDVDVLCIQGIETQPFTVRNCSVAIRIYQENTNIVIVFIVH